MKSKIELDSKFDYEERDKHFRHQVIAHLVMDLLVGGIISIGVIAGSLAFVDWVVKASF